MADTKTVNDLVSYYTNLLIIQYINKPKAKAMIELVVRTLLANGIVLDVLNGYNIETAVGKQLDIIGKYVGVDRAFQSQNLTNFFAFTYYDEVSPDSVAKYGFSNYSNSYTTVGNGTLNYDASIVTNFLLNDDDYRIIIKLKIIQNNSNHSHKSIDDSLYEFFGSTLMADSDGNMAMYYIIPSQLNQIIMAAIAKKVLPRPMGVALSYISQNEPFFGFATYDAINQNTIGFSTYSDYNSKTGDILNYDKITFEI